MMWYIDKNILINKYFVIEVLGFRLDLKMVMLCCLTSISTIFQLYRGGQFY